jgi:2-methylfumaryl-CoA isomerase
MLEGLTIVEGASFIAGPSCGLHFAQLGATVVRFEQIGGGPDATRWPLAPNGASLYREGLNKGKKSIQIDLRRAEGRNLAQRLAVAADGLFVTNFPAEGFLGYESLAALRGDLLCLRIMGWADGTSAVDYTINAACGVPAMTGSGPAPVNHVLPAWDLIAGSYGAFALLAAERERRDTGSGRELRLSLSDIAAATLGHLGQVAEALIHGDRPKYGNDLYGAFGRDFMTRDSERVMIVAITERQWQALVETLGIEDEVAAEEVRCAVSFARDEGARFIHREALNAIVGAAIADLSLAEIDRRFTGTGVCWSAYRSLSQAIAKEPRFVSENPRYQPVAHPAGTYPTPASPLRVSGRDLPPPAAAAVLGADTDEILSTLLELSSGEIGRLRDRAVVL